MRRVTNSWSLFDAALQLSRQLADRTKHAADGHTAPLSQGVLAAFGEGPVPGNHRSDWTGIKPSLSVCMKLTTASSSASDRPNRPTRLVFMLAVDSGGGQHVVPSPAA